MLYADEGFVLEPAPARATAAEAKAGRTLVTNAITAVVVCKCSKTKCLKLYCDCFKVGRLCISGCTCTNCSNRSQTDPARMEAMESTISKNPMAFKPRVTEDPSSSAKGHLAGCKCVKSNCLKKYCECFNGGTTCGPRCRCHDCRNRPDPTDALVEQSANNLSVGSVKRTQYSNTAQQINHKVATSSSSSSANITQSNVESKFLPQQSEEPLIRFAHNNTSSSSSQHASGSGFLSTHTLSSSSASLAKRKSLDEGPTTAEDDHEDTFHTAVSRSSALQSKIACTTPERLRLSTAS